MNDKYTSVLTAIIGKAVRVSEEGNEKISCAGICAKEEVLAVNLNCLATSSKTRWKKRIANVKEENWLLYLDGSKNKEERVGSGCLSHGGKIQGKKALEKLTMVWDREIVAIAAALSAWDKSKKIIILIDSQAAIAAIKKAEKTGKARTRELRRVMKMIEKGKRVLGPQAGSLGWVKSHIGIIGNKEADKKAKLGAKKEDPTSPVITEGGLQETWKKMKREKRCMKGIGEGSAVKWERKARVLYVHCRTNKGNLQSWRHKLDNTADLTCRYCGNYTETGKHVALICPYREEIGQRWSS